MSKKGPSSTSISVADGPSMFSVCSSVLPVYISVLPVCSSVLPVCPSLSPVCFSVLFICLSVSPLYLILSVFYHHVSAYLPAPRFRLSFYFSVCVCVSALQPHLFFVFLPVWFWSSSMYLFLPTWPSAPISLSLSICSSVTLTCVCLPVLPFSLSFSLSYLQPHPPVSSFSLFCAATCLLLALRLSASPIGTLWWDVPLFRRGDISSCHWLHKCHPLMLNIRLSSSFLLFNTL